MSHQVTFDWLTGEDEYLREFALASANSPKEILGDGERKLVLVILRSLAAFVVLIAASGSASLSPRSMDRIETERELRIVLQMDEEAWRAKDREGHRALLDPRVDPEWLSEWRDNWGMRADTGRAYNLTLGPTRRLSSDMVQAEVNVTLPRTHWWQTANNREIRFYRNADGLWLRTIPPDDFWGDSRTLTTNYFTFHHRERDGAAVRALATEIDAQYVELHKLMGLPIPENAPLVTVIVKPGLVRTRGWSDGDIELTSPLLARIPSGASDADYLADRIFGRVSSRALRERIPYGASHRWAFILTVLRGWLEADLLGQPNAWRAEGDTIFRAQAAYQLPLRLSDIDEYYVGGVPGRDTVLWRYAAASTLIDYIVVLEGRDVLPELVRGFAEHGTWEGVIETAVGLSEKEFVSGWNQYLASTYGFNLESTDIDSTQ